MTLTLRSRLLFGFLLALGASAHAAKLVEVRTVDDEYVMIRWQDGWVRYRDLGTGPRAFNNPEGLGDDVLEKFGLPVDTAAATDPASYSLVSTDDPGYRTPVRPVKCSRKAKVSGSAWKWPDPDYTLEHTIFLKLPKKLEHGKHYRLTISPQTHSDVEARTFAFDIFRNVSEAVHANIIGYDPSQTAAKSADLYMWLGDGGARDYSSYAGRRVMLFDAKSGKKYEAGTVVFWKSSGPDCGTWNLTKSDVWNCDFSAFKQPGTYRLVVDGVGCSQDFTIADDVYRQPYKTSVLGYFFMREGESKDFFPVPRQPRYVPNVDPPGFKVFLTTMSPIHPDWKKLGGDPWDNKDWSRYKEPGEPTNPNAWGGHSDATDWDRNATHVSNIWDILLPFVLSNGRLKEDDLGIRESGNGIPDLLDEARYEVDFWLRLRDTKGGYSFGLNNPTVDDKAMYQAAAAPYMAWANAANAAMLADSFRIAGKPELAEQYRAAATEAWKVAAERDLDFKFGIGNGSIRGRDLKMMAAAFLYNVTGDRVFEDAMAKESIVSGPEVATEEADKYNQLYGTAAYLMCAKFGWRPIHHPELLANMKAAVMLETRHKNVAPSLIRPSRRSSDEAYGWFQTVEEVQRLCVAHAVATSPSDRLDFQRAMILEADYGLGRNPMNMTQMTGLGARHPEEIYTSGRNDGIPDVHPGHTPYMNAEAWSPGFMGDPQWYASRGYPAWSEWPHGEALWRARYCYCNNEFTPQQTMRGKMCLLAYLYSLRK
ncbi:glycoside hydrolase family 9 protein [Fimbriimonas ginsengisoli]|uniref:Cellulase n=1 Tax=Fimbriimonas ginsengisoli Gsoil 348 TaxID=661478 RepID=A0A068NLW4_FIMGI|nr:glycoside hydrolase family 9 protein [Fimbriimonas ginsengisoli]AIE84407.1 Cellulase [Fimbriimonas ginsengisoli Gsoil 348]